jgi:hypothetical protein
MQSTYLLVSIIASVACVGGSYLAHQLNPIEPFSTEDVLAGVTPTGLNVLSRASLQQRLSEVPDQLANLKLAVSLYQSKEATLEDVLAVLTEKDTLTESIKEVRSRSASSSPELKSYYAFLARAYARAYPSPPSIPDSNVELPAIEASSSVEPVEASQEEQQAEQQTPPEEQQTPPEEQQAEQQTPQEEQQAEQQTPQEEQQTPPEEQQAEQQTPQEEQQTQEQTPQEQPASVVSTDVESSTVPSSLEPNTSTEPSPSVEQASVAPQLPEEGDRTE